MNGDRLVPIEMEPNTATVDLNKSAVVMIDMQRDFLEVKSQRAAVDVHVPYTQYG